MVIEIAKGSKVKYELDKDSGMLMVRARIGHWLRSEGMCKHLYGICNCEKASVAVNANSRPEQS